VVDAASWDAGRKRNLAETVRGMEDQPSRCPPIRPGGPDSPSRSTRPRCRECAVVQLQRPALRVQPRGAPRIPMAAEQERRSLIGTLVTGIGAMGTAEGLHTAYRGLEERQKALVEVDGDILLPNPEPSGPVDYVLLCMEPSLGWWARTTDDARLRVAGGFRNFLFSTEDFIVHTAISHHRLVPKERCS
jgi:hypothetical protein